MFRQPLRNAKERLPLFLSECGRRARVLRDSLWRPPNRIDPSLRFVPGFCYGYWERETRGLELLKEWLSPEQFAQYDTKRYFDSNDDDHISSLKTDAAALHNLVICCVGDAGQHCEKQSRFRSRRGAIFSDARHASAARGRKHRGCLWQRR